ncbi:MAG: hypothetical protein ACLRX7_06090 [Acutalibacteraceae bacterium]
MRKRLMASTAAIIIVGFLVAFALAAKLVQDQYQLEFTRRLDSILAMMESQVDDIGQEPQGFAVKIGKSYRKKVKKFELPSWILEGMSLETAESANTVRFLQKIIFIALKYSKHKRRYWL